MKAVNFEDIQVGNRILFVYKDRTGDRNYMELIVRGIDSDDNSIISNLNGGLNIYPNDDNQYIVITDESGDD